ncbi:MAG: hypothetical protein CMJ34_06595 [Phycisphaerae bacterium]|nr:hypothetical protein [Phycisphaerae bacterium]
MVAELATAFGISLQSCLFNQQTIEYFTLESLLDPLSSLLTKLGDITLGGDGCELVPHGIKDVVGIHRTPCYVPHQTVNKLSFVVGSKFRRIILNGLGSEPEAIVIKHE